MAYFINTKECMVYKKNEKGELFRVISLRKLNQLISDTEVFEAAKSWKPKETVDFSVGKASKIDEIERLLKLGFTKDESIKIVNS
jgi:hypothetical protein